MHRDKRKELNTVDIQIFFGQSLQNGIIHAKKEKSCGQCTMGYFGACTGFGGFYGSYSFSGSSLCHFAGDEHNTQIRRWTFCAKDTRGAKSTRKNSKHAKRTCKRLEPTEPRIPTPGIHISPEGVRAFLSANFSYFQSEFLFQFHTGFLLHFWQSLNCRVVICSGLAKGDGCDLREGRRRYPFARASMGRPPWRGDRRSPRRGVASPLARAKDIAKGPTPAENPAGFGRMNVNLPDFTAGGTPKILK